MKLDDVHVSTTPLVLASAAEVDALESKLWITFPDGYREYITKLGEGVLGGSLVRIYPPWRIDKELVEWRRRINKYWFWDEGRELLPKERALECVLIGDTVNGDELAFHPARPARLFALPRDSEEIFVADGDLWTAIEWLCSSGTLVEPFVERNFEPFDSRLESTDQPANGAKVVDPEGESLDDLMDLAQQWAKRHAARKLAQEDLKKHVTKDTTSTLLYEALVLKGKFPNEPGYLAVFRIDDKTSGLAVGQFSWHLSDESHGSEYAPNQANLAKLRQSK